MQEFKIGDKVKLYKMDNETSEYEKYLGKIGIIKSFGEFDDEAYAEVEFEDRRKLRPFFENIRLVQDIIKKSDLRNGDITIYRNGKKRIVDERKEGLVYLHNFSSRAMSFDEYDEDLFDRNTNTESQWDIVKVYRPLTEETFITERTKQVKEMTLNEVCKELGYEVKIVKEEK